MAYRAHLTNILNGRSLRSLLLGRMIVRYVLHWVKVFCLFYFLFFFFLIMILWKDGVIWVVRSTRSFWHPVRKELVVILSSSRAVPDFMLSMATRTSDSRIPSSFSPAWLSRSEKGIVGRIRLVKKFSVINAIWWLDVVKLPSSFIKVGSGIFVAKISTTPLMTR